MAHDIVRIIELLICTGLAAAVTGMFAHRGDRHCARPALGGPVAVSFGQTGPTV